MPTIGPARPPPAPQLPSISDILSLTLHPAQNSNDAAAEQADKCPICYDLLEWPVKLRCHCEQRFCDLCISKALIDSDWCPVCRFRVLAPLETFWIRPSTTTPPSIINALTARVVSGEVDHPELLLIQGLATVFDDPVLRMAGLFICTIYAVRANYRLCVETERAILTRPIRFLSVTATLIGCEAVLSVTSALPFGTLLGIIGLNALNVGSSPAEIWTGLLGDHARANVAAGDAIGDSVVILTVLRIVCRLLHAYVVTRDIRRWWVSRQR